MLERQQALVGTVQARRVMRRKSDKGDWEMRLLEIRGQDGRVQSAIINGPAGIPPTSEFIVLPVYFDQNGGLRETRHLSDESF
jgi:hypothetical protein